MMDILFWSGGKDAYLALEFYRKINPESTLKLLTTYNKKDGQVPHQNIPIAKIKEQATFLNLELILVELPENCPNNIYLRKVHEALQNQPGKISTLLFGDWYLQDIRDWREDQFTKSGYNCRFPIWEKSIHELLPILLLKNTEVRISAVNPEYRQFIKVGEIFNQHFVQQLPKEIDPMGEKGEFHTEVIFKETKK